MSQVLQAESDPISDVRIVLADDHQIFREGLRRLLESEPGFSVVGEAANGIEALELLRRVQPDILLLDLAMPRLSGLDTLRALIEAHPVKVIILTAAIGESDVLRAIQLGAVGVVMKGVASRMLFDDIKRVMSGDYIVGHDLLGELVHAVRRPDFAEDKRPFDLTRRELDIIGAITAGQGNREIAHQLHVSVQTVKHHLTRIFDKTGVSSRLELALFAIQHHLN